MTASLALKAAIGLLMIDAIFELAFVSNTVSYLHNTASKGYNVNYQGGAFLLAGEPASQLVDQGHTSNGAAGTAFVLIGVGGILALWLRSRHNFSQSTLSIIIYNLWVALNIPALLLTIGALAFTFAVTNSHANQTIDVAFASALNGAKYPLDTWTPQGWFSAVLDLDLVDARSNIEANIRLMRGWQYNLIPMMLLQIAETVLAIWDFISWRRQGKTLERSDM